MPNANLTKTFKPVQLMKDSLRTLNKYKVFYLMALPVLLYVLIFHYIPMAGVLLAFKEFKPTLGISSIFFGDWVGFENFKTLFGSYYFSRVFTNTLIISGYKLVFGFPAPILLALLINELRSTIFKRVVQTVTFLPHFLSWVIVTSLMVIILSPSFGFMQFVYEFLGIKPVYVLGSSEYFRSLLVVSDIWKNIGYGSIIYLAAMASIDVELYEAATIDGASRLQKMIYITLPGIKEIIIILFIFNIAAVLDAGFEQIYLLYSPSVYNVADIIDTYVFREGLIRANYGFATAVGLTKASIALVLVILTNKVARKFGSGSLW